MQSNTFNQTTTSKPSFLHMIMAGIMATIMLIGGFFVSLFLLATSVILLPLALFKINKLKRQFEENLDTMNPSQDDHNIIEGEFVVAQDATQHETKNKDS